MFDETALETEVLPAYEGRLSSADNDGVTGWVRDTNHRSHLPFVTVWVDGRAIATVVPSEAQAGADLPMGCGVFTVVLPQWLYDNESHHIRATVLHSDPEFVIGSSIVRLTSAPPASLDGSPAIDPPNNIHIHRLSKPGLTNKPTSARAIVGKDNWLFLADDSNRVREQLTGTFQVPQKLIDNYRRVFAQRRETFSKLGIPYYFFSAPTKELVCDTKLPAGLDFKPELYPPNIISQALKQDGFVVHSLFDAVHAAHQLEQCYYRTDTHWNYLGAFKGYEKMIEVVRQSLPGLKVEPRSTFTSKILKSYRGDLANKEKLFYVGGDNPLIPCHPQAFDPSIFSEELEQFIDRTGRIEDKEVPPYLQVSDTRPTLVKENKDRTLPRLFMLRDSFATLVAPFMAHSFSRSAYVWKPDVDFSIIQRERPDVVIQLMVDRFMVRQPANVVQ